ncbi:tetratricopeptide repeat-containing hybrid sensor histidine kinase/response regulator [Flavobacterium glaciei]|uniref:histidine kinase n=1 Tax=Flavobacterium glaciei TaxID=386300 RepID=A0A562PJD6_9FLAO|nr:response regulator [Flavobacterium glaciei]RDI50279.1 signal transduction histidine kinase [Flavobacterium glaciei]TWI44529.1 signal transduction histidine kinase [Flavobacterium glaciei]
MCQIRVILLVLLVSNTFNDLIAQKKLYSKKELTELTEQASHFLNDANFEKSLKISKEALHKSIVHNDSVSTTISYITIAANYAELAEFDKAIYFYQKGLLYANKTHNDTLKNRINNNLGNIYCFEKKQYIKGINFFENALKYSIKIADSSQIFMTKLNITWAYFDVGHFEKGYTNLEFINGNNIKYGDKSTAGVVYMLNGMYHGNKGNDEKANAYFLNAIKSGNETNEKSDLSFAHLEYSKFLLKKGDYKKAYQNLILYNKITEILYNKDKLKKANVAGINVELDEYKREIEKFESEKEAQHQIVQKTKTIVILFMLILFVLLLFVYNLFKNNNFRKKLNSELSKTNEQLILAKEKAEEASVLKSQFVSTISHELRTPLYGVVGITNMLIDEHKELANSPHLSSLKFSARYLLSLVNDILQINKIEDNRMILENMTFNISDEINMVINSLSFLAKNNNNFVIVKIDPAIPEYLIGDKLRLSQIIMNLVSNALKFTLNGEVTISLNLEKIEDESYFINFEIKDNGIGIALDDQEKIFDKFVQIGRKETDYQGTGLGLSIVKQLLGLFNSTIAIQSSIDVGTTFKFVIAFEYNMEKTIEIINNIQVDITSNQTIKVLVVEDNHINQLVTKKTIEKNNYKCIVVDNGYAALEILDKEFFDVILMDINMPLINGFETTRKIRLMGIDTPIVALTAFDKAEITEEALSAGINDIIIKPFDSLKLFSIITILISKN